MRDVLYKHQQKQPLKLPLPVYNTATASTHLSPPPSSFSSHPNHSACSISSHSRQSTRSRQSRHSPGYGFELSRSGMYLKRSTPTARSKCVEPEDPTLHPDCEQSQALDAARKQLNLALYTQDAFPEYNADGDYMKAGQRDFIREVMHTSQNLKLLRVSNMQSVLSYANNTYYYSGGSYANGNSKKSKWPHLETKSQSFHSCRNTFRLIVGKSATLSTISYLQYMTFQQCLHIFPQNKSSRVFSTNITEKS